MCSYRLVSNAPIKTTKFSLKLIISLRQCLYWLPLPNGETCFNCHWLQPSRLEIKVTVSVPNGSHPTPYGPKSWEEWEVSGFWKSLWLMFKQYSKVNLNTLLAYMHEYSYAYVHMYVLAYATLHICILHMQIYDTYTCIYMYVEYYACTNIYMYCKKWYARYVYVPFTK